MRTPTHLDYRVVAPGLGLVAMLTLTAGCVSTPPTGEAEGAQQPRVIGEDSDLQPSVVDEVALAGEGPPSELAVAPEESDIERAAREVESREVKVVETTAQAEKYLTEDQLRAARRECMRRLRRVTGSRIPRNACQGSMGLFPSGFNQIQENNNPRGAAPQD